MPTAPAEPRLIRRANGPPLRVVPADSLIQTDAATYLGHHRITLVRWGRAGRGPAHYKIGGTVFYPLSGLDAHLRGAS